MRVLVTGGGGFIGSVVVEELLAAGAERVVVLDDLSKGHAAAVAPAALLLRADIGDAGLVEELCRREALDGVVHMAASSLVGESMQQPARYYDNNLVRGLSLLRGALDAGVRRLLNPHIYHVSLTDRLWNLKQDLVNDALTGAK